MRMPFCELQPWKRSYVAPSLSKAFEEAQRKKRWWEAPEYVVEIGGRKGYRVSARDVFKRTGKYPVTKEALSKAMDLPLGSVQALELPSDPKGDVNTKPHTSLESPK